MRVLKVAGTGIGAMDQDEVEKDRADPSLEVVFATHRSRLVALASAVAGWAEADDVVQETYLRAAHNWGRVASYDRPDLWLRRVTLNLASSRRRRWLSEFAALTRLAQRRPETNEILEPRPEVWAAVRRLPDRQRRIVALRYVDEQTVTEIAQVLHLAEPTVRVHLHRARHALARMLGEDQPSDEEDRP